MTTLTWRDGYKQRVLPKSDSASLDLPYWAINAPPMLQQIYIDAHQPDGTLIERVQPWAALSSDRAYAVGRCKLDNVMTLVLPQGEDGLSRSHLVLIYTRQGLMLFDNYSSHGSWLNGQRMQPGVGEPVFDGDVVHIGQTPAVARSLVFGGMGLGRALGEEHFLKIAKEQAAAAPPMVRARHLLLKHTGSRNPICWKSPNPVTRTPAEALAGVTELRRRIVEGNESFEYLASLESECSSHTRGGDLGPFTFETMHPEFSRAAFALNVGEVSPPTESPSGWHIIMRIA